MVRLLLWLATAGTGAQAALPVGWTDADLGGPALAGSASYSGNTWTISGGGTAICNNDQLHFAWTPVNGDGWVAAKVESIQGPPGAQAGVMFRNDLTPGSIEAAVLATAASGVTFQWRISVGLPCYYQVVVGMENLGAPIWVKLLRSGSQISGHWSTNNIDWYQVGSTQTVPLNLGMLGGLAVSASDNASLSTATFTGVLTPEPLFGLYRELWPGLNPDLGNTLAALTNSTHNPNWPNNPEASFTRILASFEVEANTGMSWYGQRLRGFVVPPVDGNYTFWISSDNTSELFLSNDETPARASRIAWVSTATNPREWTREPNQRSAALPLKGGNRYYLEGLMQQSTDNDSLAVRWTLPSGTNEEPLMATSSAGTWLVPYRGIDAPPGIYVQPTNLVVPDGLQAEFTLLATNQAAVTYQWRSNGTNLPGAAALAPVYRIDRANPAIHNQQSFTCVVSNAVGVVTSAPAVLTVIADLIRPTVVRAAYLSSTNLQIAFSEPVEAATATNTANYAFTNGLPVAKASLSPDNLVTLTTGPMTFGNNYGLVINGVRDRATTPNVIATNTFILICAAPYTSQGIGGPTPPGILSGAPGGFDLTGSGAQIGGTADQFQFAYLPLTGDFDYRVRMENLSQTDMFAKGGLMAREDLTQGSRFAGVFSTPTINGSVFQSRATVNANTTSSGNLPGNYPDTWLRLKRTGNQFTGYAGYDGVTWQPLGTATLNVSNTLYFGMAVCSRAAGQLATGEFRQLSSVSNATTGVLRLPHEPPGPSSRRTGLVISEIMYHPQPRLDGRRVEFVEIFNPQPFTEEISGYRLSGDVSYTFPAGTVLQAGACLVIAAVPADMMAIYGINNVVGPYTNSLSNGSGTVRLRNKMDAVLLEANYDSSDPWPAAADGTGHSLVLARPSYGEGSPLAWAASDRKGGSPGTIDGFGAEPARGVVINEFLAHTDLPLVDAIELFNTGTAPIQLSGCYLTDDPDTNKFRIPDGTQIGGRGFLAFTEAQLGFRLDAEGETIYLVNAANTRVLDAVKFEGQANGVSMGRYPDGAPTFRALSARTLGTNNPVQLTPPIVINEIMYNPISGNDDDQYVELYNRSASRVDLGGWRFTAGISLRFPTNTFLAANGYLVVARNMTRMLTNYPNLNSTNLAGNFDGSLSGRGERVALSMPDQIVSTNSHGVVSTNTIYIVVNDVPYDTGGHWGQWSDGGGSSLELIDPDSDIRLAPSWADSDETGKAAWANIEATGVLNLGAAFNGDQLHVILQGAGECLVDSVEVFKAGEANRITNPNFDNSTTGWTFQGTHRYTTVDTSGGYGGSGRCLHIRATGRGDTGANRIRTTLSSALVSGDTATLRAKVRWLKGNPEILLRLHGNWLETAGQMALPANLGTPGARSSRFITNAGPAIVEVSHWPVLPAAAQPVVVKARVTDPDGVGAVALYYRPDTAGGATVSVNMVDNGAAGDEFAGDRVYSATIPGQTAATLIAFYVQARDGAVMPVTANFPNNAPVRECLVRFGEFTLAGTLGNYRTWVTQSNVTYWASREKNSNDPIDATFVYGDFRVVYNMQTLYSGSPFHTGGYSGPTGSACDYVLTFPDDNRLLGANDFILATLGNLGNDNSGQREQAAFWMLRELRVPSLHRRHMHMWVNGSKRGTVLEDSQQPSSDVIDEHFPDDPDGNLHKIEDWFEFNDAGSGFSNFDATLDNFTTTGGAKKMARYRWNWRPRAVKDSANDFTNLFTLVDALHAARPEPYTREVQAMMDVENWMRVLAVERFVGNWDSFSYNRGKNMYAYKPRYGPWSLLPWDIDFVLGSGSDGTSQPLFGGQDASMNTLRSFAPFQRAYYRAFQDLVDGPALDSRIGPMMESKYNGLVANGIAVDSPSAIRTWVSQRRSYVLSQLSAVTAGFTVSSLTVSNNLAVLTGTAPVKVETILINGNAYPVTWTAVTTWTAVVPLRQGQNPLSVTGIDHYGQFVNGATNYVTATYPGVVPSPTSHVVINEVMYDALFPNANYVELYNTSSNVSFDLSNWRFNGLAYTFPPGAVLRPTDYLVLASDRYAYLNAYGLSTPAFDTFGGALQRDGETLTLIQPGTNTASDLTVARIRYDGAAPWPVVPGSSLQLADSRRDNWRAGNWTAVPASGFADPQWVYFATNGTPTTSLLYVYLRSAGDIYIDDIKLVSGTVPEVGSNLLSDGDFESGFPGPWTVSPNLSNSTLSTTVKHSGTASLHLVSTGAGSGQSTSIYQSISPALTTGQVHTLSFWYRQSTNGGPLTIRLSGSGISATVNPAPPAMNLARFTPATSNSVSAALPAFPPLWINELQADNLTGITNRAGQRTAWLELYNPGTNVVQLTNLFLANSYSSLTAWPFPAGASINPRQFKVIFADGQTSLSTSNEPHTSFTLSSGAGSIALSRIHDSKAQVLDYINYTNLGVDHSYGSFPDGQSFDRQEFYYATPGGTNNGLSAPLSVAINEWMADNKLTLADPADGDFEDWFELYNYGTNTVDLYDYYLSDTYTNRTQYHITGHYLIPPRGFLLVWADNETGQNSTNRRDLHVNFKLDKVADGIGLFGADGKVIDFVSFANQTTDLSMGRYPDGATAVAFLPTATPRTNNPAANTAPSLQVVPDQALVLGQMLMLVAIAADADRPAQNLTFSLGAGAPPEATLDSLTGQLTWTPVAAPGTNPFTIFVTDDGVPSLGASQSFLVTVYLPPQLQDLSVSGNEFSFSFDSIAGTSYLVEYKDDLAEPLWLPFGDPFTGTGEPLVVIQDISQAAARFFRVRLLP